MSHRTMFRGYIIAFAGIGVAAGIFCWLMIASSTMAGATGYSSRSMLIEGGATMLAILAVTFFFYPRLTGFSPYFDGEERGFRVTRSQRR